MRIIRVEHRVIKVKILSPTHSGSVFCHANFKFDLAGEKMELEVWLFTLGMAISVKYVTL